MNNIKIIFFDIDGTLIEKKKKITPKILETLKKLKENHIKICIATGRSPIQLPELGINFDVYLTFNGSYCFNDQNTIFEQSIPKEDVKTIIKNAHQIERPVAVATKNQTAVNGLDADLKEYFAFGGKIPTVSKNFDEIVANERIYQMMMSCRKKDYDKILQNVKNAQITAWWDRAVDIIPTTGNKGIAIEKVLNYYSISKAEAMAFGDGRNDIEMLEAVGHGIAMGNAIEDVKEIADAVCDSVRNDGIYRYCKGNNLI